jgi:transcriptional regulator with XRE-family HTH domain
MVQVGRPARSRTERRLPLAGAVVVQARRQSGWSQRQLARRAGVSRTTIAEIEAGTRDPGLNTLRAVLNGAGFDVEIRLVAFDDHDAVLAETLDALPASDRARLERGFQHFVGGLADGLATSQPLITTDE